MATGLPAEVITCENCSVSVPEVDSTALPDHSANVGSTVVVNSVFVEFNVLVSAARLTPLRSVRRDDVTVPL